MAGKFGTAAAQYRGLTETYPHNADLWFNLGTSEAHAGRLGHAAHALETALWLDAGHPNAKHNLAQLKDSVVEKALAQSRTDKLILPGTDDLGTGLLSSLPLEPVRFIFAGSWLLFFAFWLLIRYRPNRRTALSLLLIISGLLSVCAGGLLLSRTYIIDDAQYGVILSDTSAHRGPGSQYAKQADVSLAVKVRLGGKDRNWRQVTLPNGQGGWVPAGDVAQMGARSNLD